MLAVRLLALAACLALLLAAPLAMGGFTTYQVALFMLYGMAAQGVGLCWGRAGFLPLGQALFFGIGAYLSGWGLKQGGGDLLVWLPYLAFACLAPAALAMLVGELAFARQAGPGPYFSLITLALAMLGFQLANSWESVTGGFNGMMGIPAPAGLDPYDDLYDVIAPVLFVVTLALGRLRRSPFGLLLLAIAEDEERLQFFGFRTSSLKAWAFAISAAVAGLAGALFAAHQGIVTPQALGVVLSTEIVVWTAVGGKGALLGPVIGAIAVELLAARLRDSFSYWEIVEALAFIAIVLKFPQGLSGFASSWAKRRFPRWFSARAAEATPAPALPTREGIELVFGDVHVERNGLRILDGLDLHLDRPGVHCVIGPNGAGKTSAFNVLTGRLRASRGDIRWRGQSIVGKRLYEIARLGIARKFQIPSVFSNLSVRENLLIATWANRLRGRSLLAMAPFGWRGARWRSLARTMPFLTEGETRAGSLSLGQRQMLEFAMANLMEPSLLLLDEPCAGLSPRETTDMIDAIAGFSAEFGGATLVIEHDMRVVEQLADHVYVLHLGAKLAEGSLAVIKTNQAVRAVYAGGSK